MDGLPPPPSRRIPTQTHHPTVARQATFTCTQPPLDSCRCCAHVSPCPCAFMTSQVIT